MYVLCLEKAHDLVMEIEKEIQVWLLSVSIINKYLLSAYYAWTTSVNKTDNDLFSWSLYFKCEDQRINMKIINDVV